MRPSVFDSVIHGAKTRRAIQEAADLLEVGAAARARALLEPVLRVAAGDARAMALLGHALIECDQLERGFALLENAVRLAPDLAEARVFLAREFERSGRIGEALEHLEAAVAAAPDSPLARRALVRPLLESCDWAAARRERELLEARTRSDRRWTEFVTPLDSLLLGLPAPQRRAVAQARAADLERVERRYAPAAPRIERRGAKLRVGYLSGDFRDRPLAHLAAHLFRRHDRDRFEIYAFAYGRDDGSRLRRAVVEGVDRFFDVRPRANAEIARVITNAGIDILVDLAGHASGARIGVLAHRPAQIQLHYLGYPGTTGASFVDYYVADRVLATPALHGEFTERFVLLPESYLGSDPEIADAPPARRHEHGLPEDEFVFCNFNPPSRIGEKVWTVWMEILRAVPKSVLWLKDANPLARRNLQNAAGTAGIEPSRLIFAPETSDRFQHVSRLRLADLMLDTFGSFSGRSSTVDALWAGVPVVTIASDSLAGRMSASALSSAGMSECIMADTERYREFAVECARDPGRISELRARLSEARATAPFFDPDRLVRDLERAYLAMWERFTAGLEPAVIEIAATSASGHRV